MIVYTHLLLQFLLMLRVLLRPHREPASRLAWIVVILTVPVLGMFAYLMLGETRLGRRRLARYQAAKEALPAPNDLPGPVVSALPAAEGEDETEHDRYSVLFRVGRSISGFPATTGNAGRLMDDADDTVSTLIADIDAARDHVHLLFYIWLPDGNGTRVAEALMRAAQRGVTCRALADDLGSRAMIGHALWGQMREAGVHLAAALPIGNVVLRALFGRIDLRNHRKIVVIDNEITYCGSQNCADPAFLPKAKYAPWVDVMMRLTGPVVRQNQLLFARDWMTEVPDDDLHPLIDAPVPDSGAGFAAQVIAQGPTDRPSAAPEMFTSVMFAAERELIVSTPYFVPVDSIVSALRAAANRGVDVTLVLPARNDDFAVGAASRSYYADLIGAGVKLYEYRPGLLHAKTLTIDGTVTLIGSANMDCRSFALNFENNILLRDRVATHAMRARQMTFVADSTRITAEAVKGWRWYQRLWNNALAIVGPLL